MDTKDAEKQLVDAFVEFASDFPQTALSIITGLFVGLLVHAVEEGGGDPDKQITVDGCGQRDITVHAVGKKAAQIDPLDDEQKRIA